MHNLYGQGAVELGVVFMGLGMLSGAVYYVLCLIGYGQQGGGWFIAALLIPPIDVFYPIAATAMFDEPFPMGLLMLGLISVGSLAAASWLDATETG